MTFLQRTALYLSSAVVAFALLWLWWHLPPVACNKDGLNLQGCYYASRH
ncbi:hypothetical protein JQ557_05865 [Bradyrhizobium sp. U87765 SZCCT0131]|nr:MULTISPECIES: hypothetical protein [unclassified Bradyrhizobium]MBR1217503.1 hypothetical protein [Bradyrhizobium sp. U87765 SZCCT0131]MBR1264899.1 hypothetical protein [Bradyrhizobium sp. U87765 SZCCT0134]MBR1304881.1 hypothetical protein [Bradyrhizobium sp. U87765 SZCCT0110]MBR1320668.1 hypothetical protein [Bradyrhizobium sp. U87765 SZCCT0109]MBR1349088.1 hypothetical protein [Bradyrhizobium sp. U87765 SZCCT0048]